MGAAQSTDAMVFDRNVCVSMSVFVPVCVCVCVALSKRVCKSDRHTRATQVTCGSTLPLVGRMVIKNSICVCVCVCICVCACVCVCVREGHNSDWQEQRHVRVEWCLTARAFSGMRTTCRSLSRATRYVWQ